MSNKQMYFKVQFNGWDSYSEEKKNFINFFMKDAVATAGVVTAEESDNFYSYAVGRKQDFNSSYYDTGIHFSNEGLPHGLIQSNAEIESMILAKPDSIYHKIADITILPTIDGKINTDSNASLVLPSGQSYEICNVNSVGEYSLPYRTSSFGIKLGSSEIESVHYKIGILDITDWDEGTPITDSIICVSMYENNRTEISIDNRYFANTDDYFPYREIGYPITEWDELNYKVRYMYIELCKDGGGYFDDFGVNSDTAVTLYIMDPKTHEWYTPEVLNLVIAKNLNDDYLEGSFNSYLLN